MGGGASKSTSPRFANPSRKFARGLSGSIGIATLISTLPFLVVGGWWVRLQIANQTPQALLAVLMPLALALAIGSNARTIGKTDSVGSPTKQRSLGSWVAIILLFWLVIQWINLLALSQRDIPAFQSVLIASATALGFLFFFQAGIDPMKIHMVFALAGAIGAVLIIFESLIAGSTLTNAHTIQYLLLPLVSVLVLGSRRHWYLLLAPIIVQAIFIPSPRAAIGTALIIALLAMAFLPTKKILLRFSVGAGFTLIGWTNLSFNTRVIQRFNETGDRAVRIPVSPGNRPPEQVVEGDNGELAQTVTETAGATAENVELILNTNGRINVWSALIRDIEPAQVFFGKGAGYSRSFVSDYAGWAQPHNEYLRLLVDFGVLGLVTWLTAVLLLGIFAVKYWRLSPHVGFGLVGAILVLSIMNITSLPMVSYGFIMPFAILAGSSARAIHNSRNKSINCPVDDIADHRRKTRDKGS